MLPEALLSQPFCSYNSSQCLHRQRSGSAGDLVFKVVGEGGSPLKSGGGVLRKQASQSLRGVPALPTTRCSCVLISANNNAGSKRSSSPNSGKMRRSILQFAKRLWNSEDGAGRKVLCTNCKSDPVTLDTLCKKCCRRSTVCPSCYTRILSMHHTRLDRFGSMDEPPSPLSKCSECNLTARNTSPPLPRHSTTSNQPHPPNRHGTHQPPSLPAGTPPKFRPGSMNILPVIPDNPPQGGGGGGGGGSVTKEKSSSSSDSEYQSCSENIDPDSPSQTTIKLVSTPPTLGKPAPITPPIQDEPPFSSTTVQDKPPLCPTAIHDKPPLYTASVKNKAASNSTPYTITATPVQLKSQTLTPLTEHDTVAMLKRAEPPRTVAMASSATPPISMATRSRMTNPNRPAMIRSRAIEECDELDHITVKRSSMVEESVLLQSDQIIIPTFGCTPVKPDKTPAVETDDFLHTPVAFQRSYSESSKDRRPLIKLKGVCRERCGSVSDTRFLNNLSSCHGNNLSSCHGNITTPAKRTVRIVEEANKHHSRPSSLELEHVTVGEVTPTLYVKDKNNVVDSSFQQSESVLKRSLSVSNSRLQRKLSKKLGSKDRQTSDEAPFLRRNRCTSVDKSSPPPDLLLMSKAGIHLEDIQAFGYMYVQKLENRMRNIDALKELEKQHNISCRERLKTALDTHEQLAAGLEDVKKQLKECMDKYRFISETFV